MALVALMSLIRGSFQKAARNLNRRGFMTVGSLAMGGIGLPQILRAEAAQQRPTGAKGTIMVFLPGGPPHLDMFDPKPNAPSEIRGEFSPIRSSVTGIEICELMPRLAGMMEDLVPIRSLVGAIDQHDVHQVVTGWEHHPTQTGSREVVGYPPGGWPSLGAVASNEIGPAVKGVPVTVDLSPDYYDARFVHSTKLGTGGFLGPAHAGLELSSVDTANFTVTSEGVRRLSDRRHLLASFDRFRKVVDKSGTSEKMDTYSRQAFDVLASGRLARAMDLSQEDESTRNLYGIDAANPPKRGGGKMLDQFLLARRVIEAGARCVTLVFSRYPYGRMLKGDYNWDWHKENFMEARETLPLLDIGVSALITDLKQRGLLDDVSVVVWGEFGRTPKINTNAGRDHWPRVAGALLAGGGMKGGQVLGSTNKFGEHAESRPVHYREVFATLYQQLGIDVRHKTFDDLSGRPQHLLGNHGPLQELL